jgi:hypothetical protein
MADRRARDPRLELEPGAVSERVRIAAAATPSLPRMFDTCTLAVVSVMKSSVAISGSTVGLTAQIARHHARQ